jgi:hypothetical protein
MQAPFLCIDLAEFTQEPRAKISHPHDTCSQLKSALATINVAQQRLQPMLIQVQYNQYEPWPTRPTKT